MNSQTMRPGAFGWLVMTAVCMSTSIAAGTDARYFNLRIPEGEPQPFRPAIFEQLGVLVPTHPTFSPDYSRFVFSTANFETPGQIAAALFESRFDGRMWTRPTFLKSLHAEGFSSSDPAFSPDGRFFYFTSTRPPGSPPWNGKVFRTRVTNEGYAELELIDLSVAPIATTFYPQITSAGHLIFTSNTLPGKGLGELYISELLPNGRFSLPRAIDGDFNTENEDWDLVEHPSGDMRIWVSGRAGGVGAIDMYYSRRNSNGEWSLAENLRAVNTPGIETAPRISPDGEVLFFQRFVNGREQIFWVKLSTALGDPADQ